LNLFLIYIESCFKLSVSVTTTKGSTIHRGWMPKWPFWQSFVVPALWRWSNFHAPTWRMSLFWKGDGWENSIHMNIWVMKWIYLLEKCSRVPNSHCKDTYLIQVEWAKGTTKNAGWSQRRVTMKENYHGCNEVEWARCRIDFSIAIPQNLYILGWEAYQYVSVYFVQVDQFVVKPIGAREILRQLCLKLNFVWLWSGDLSIFSHITSYLGC